MKRKNEGADDVESGRSSSKRPATEPVPVQHHFQKGLFEAESVTKYAQHYASSGPYKHAVIHGLINDDLLRAVRNEIKDNIHFTPKETDIYKIHQSGDLANLNGLPASALERLPSLLKLRDALYSLEFRQWISSVSGAGLLSGEKTDMAVNVYVPGCHLLCHDDVIGSRRVSYILYLNDPDKPWQASWGGALRLFATDEVTDPSGKKFKLPQSDFCKTIPPAWNQLSFFAVQPGESFHDVEEVYRRQAGESEDDGGRVRMAISGWFHIPQEGEEGFVPGLEEKLAESSSLQQLQGKADEFDTPQTQWHPSSLVDNDDEGEEDEGLTEEDCQFLLQFLTPNYLTPDTVEELNELFTDESILQLSNFLSNKFVHILREDLLSSPSSSEKYPFTTSRPPHKHHYQFIPAPPTSQTSTDTNNNAPFTRILNELLPSRPFAKWLSLVTGVKIKSWSAMARRFRRGVDYQLAQEYLGEEPLLEYTLCVTPTRGWGGDDDDEEAAAAADSAEKIGEAPKEISEEDNVGGYELYMAGDNPDNDDDEGSDDGAVTIPPGAAAGGSNTKSQTGAGDRRSTTQKSTKKGKASDPAIYQSAGEDDGILFSNAASWNTLSIVLRDRGTLKFVKYVSLAAPGDRWDYTGSAEVEFDDEEEEDEE
jgi:Rps23 Pro-64 3,4-dihydroxylase Tpa1-like proline 4-hydroxylase